MSKSNISKNKYMLKGPLKKKGYDWWWHSLTARNELTNEEKAFYIEYYITNPAICPDKVILGQSSEEALPSYFMMNVGTWGKDKKQIHQFYPVSEVSFHEGGLPLKVANCFLSETRMYGECIATKEEASNKAYMTDAGEMKWDLKINKELPFNAGYATSKLIRNTNAFEMFWHAEGIKTRYSGFIICDNEKYIVSEEDSYGYADKNWGSDFTSPWLWISSCNLYSNKYEKQLNNSAIEFGGGKPKIAGMPLDGKIVGCIFYEDEYLDFNFSKFWEICKTNFSFKEENGLAIWKINASNLKYKIEIDLTCETKDMLLINYEAPNGKKRHNHLLNGGTGKGTLKIFDRKHRLVDEINFYNTGCEYGVYNKEC